MAEDFKPGAKVTRWEKRLADPKVALKQIGVMMVAESQQSFKAQQHGKTHWDERAPVNVYGIIADFAAGKKAPPAHRFQTRPALKDTGRLAASIAFKVTGSTTVEVGSNLAYAGTHQFGGPIESKTITQGVQDLLWDWLKGQSKDRKKALGFLLNKKFTGETLKGEVVARPFLGITKDTIDDVREIVGVEIMEVG